MKIRRRGFLGTLFALPFLKLCSNNIVEENIDIYDANKTPFEYVGYYYCQTSSDCKIGDKVYIDNHGMVTTEKIGMYIGRCLKNSANGMVDVIIHS